VAINDPKEIQSLNTLQVASATENLYYSSVAMVEEIDRMPTDIRTPLEQQHPVQTLKEEGGSSHLIVYSRRPHSVTLEVPTIQIRYEARGVPHKWRSKKYRPEAEAVANHLFPREESGPGLGTSTPTKYVASNDALPPLWHSTK
jgi:hypothetical protein